MKSFQNEDLTATVCVSYNTTGSVGSSGSDRVLVWQFSFSLWIWCNAAYWRILV